MGEMASWVKSVTFDCGDAVVLGLHYPQIT